LLFWLAPQAAVCQIGASAAISLIARLPGTVSLNQSAIPFTITVAHSQQRTEPVQFEVKWNLDPRETQSFRIIATYSPKSGDSSQLTVRVDGADPRPFSTHSRIVLLNLPIRVNNRQGRQVHTLAILFDDTQVMNFPDGDYNGTLTLTIERQ